MKRRLDHIVYAVSDLAAALEAFEKVSGVKPVFGGHHKKQGTKNALVNLSDDCYLEFLAIDETNTAILPPRWMGVDMLTKNQVTRIALKSENLEKDSAVLSSYNPTLGNIQSGSRNTDESSVLKWKLIMPLASPEVELAPFFLDWSESETHPSAMLPDMGCSLNNLVATHPTPKAIVQLYKSLAFDMDIKESALTRFVLTLNTPKGKVEL